MQNYELPSEVHFCITDDGAVFLDLNRDKYFGLGVADACALKQLCRGERVDVAEVRELASRLLEDGLLTKSAREAPPTLTPVRYQAATEMLADLDADNDARIRMHHVGAMTLSYISATTLLRFRSLASAVRHVRRVSESAVEHASDSDCIHDARDLLLVFRKMRPMFYVAQDRCLFDSLVLYEFFRRYGFHLSWVFGVRTAPFMAHCWVQYGEYLLNDNAAFVQGFTPILALAPTRG